MARSIALLLVLIVATTATGATMKFDAEHQKQAQAAIDDAIAKKLTPGAVVLVGTANETLFLQIAESGAVDKPALAPIGFGVSAVRKEMSHVE